MSDNRQPVDHQDEKANPIRDQRGAYGVGTGIGGGLVGAAIGGLVGRRVGGVVGSVVGVVAGALVGKGTAQRVNRTVESVVEAAKTAERVAEAVNHSANSVGNAIKDTVEETKSSVIGVVDAIKDTVEETKSSVVSAAKSVAEGVNHTVNDVKTVGNAVKDAVEEVKPSLVDVVDAIKDTVEEVKPSLVDVAKSVAEGVNHTVSGLSHAGKDIVEEVKPPVIAVENPTKDTVEETELSLVGAANSVAEDINHTINGLNHALKDTVEETESSPVVGAANSVVGDLNLTVNGLNYALKDTVEEVNPSDNYNSKVYEEQLVGVELRRLSQEHFFSNDVKEKAPQRLQDSQESKNSKEIDIIAIKYKNIQQRQEEFQRNQQETAQELKRQRSLLRTENIQKITGILLGAATISLISVVWGFTSRQNLLATKYPESNLVIKSPESGIISTKSNLQPKLSPLATKSPTFNQSVNPVPKTTPKIIADGWIFLGNINKTSSSKLVGKSLIKGSQSINSDVVPSAGSIVTVSVRPGVTLRKNRPQAPNFNPKDQKALAIIKQTEKLKILKVESITPSNTTRPVKPATKIWAQVDRCGSSCN